MIKKRKIDPAEYMRLHKSRLHDDYHNFKTKFLNVIENDADPSGLFELSRQLINTIQACASNGHQYANSKKRNMVMDTPASIIVNQSQCGEMVTSECES